jgi:DNA polymerase-3 subunit gamma/tau
MVVDELIAYLKEKMYKRDALFSTLVLDRFFRILSDSKYLFSINADGSFVLSMIFFKMIEALRIREVDQMIESLQREVQRPEIITPAPTKIKVTTATPEMATLNMLESESKSEEQKEIKEDPSLKIFEQLIAKIKDRNHELGECFTNNISFVSFENNILTWESCADEACKKSLTHGYAVVKQLVREVFSFQTKIKGLPCRKTVEESKPQVQQPKMDEPQSDTMIEDAEMGGNASCVSNCNDTAPLDEANGVDITQEPMVQKAIEMFEAKKVTVQSKI